MSEQQIDNRTSSFLRDQVRTSEALEILLLLHEHPGLDFSPRKVHHYVQSTTEATVCDRLEMLHMKGLITKAGAAHDPIYRLELGDPDRAQMMARISRLYSSQKVSVIQALFPPTRSAISNLGAVLRLKRDYIAE